MKIKLTRNSISDMLFRSQKYADHVLALFMALFALGGYRYAAQQAGMSVIRFILQATLAMFPLMLGGCLVMSLFGHDHSPAHLTNQSLQVVRSLPELIVLDGFALAAVRDRKILIWGVIGVGADFMLMLACKIADWERKRGKRQIIKA